MSRKSAAPVLDDHQANEDEESGQFDNESLSRQAAALDGDDDDEITTTPYAPIATEALKRPVGEIFSTIALQGVSSHAKKRPISALDDGWIRTAWGRLTGLLSDKRDATEATAWKADVHLLETAAAARGLDLFVPVENPKTEPVSAAPAVPLEEGELLTIPLTQLIESPKNPRKRFDPAGLLQMESSLKEHGQLTPAIARPLGLVGRGVHHTEMYELAAGHRRFRAAKKAGLPSLRVVVRKMTDVQLLEILTIENNEREDVHELEEAQGYKDLIAEAGYTAARIAERIQRSEKYVWDRLKLLELIPELQEIFLDKKIEAGHAILLARLTPAQQKRAADYPHGGLWAFEENPAQVDLDLPDAVPAPKKTGGHGSLKPRSVRELQAWIIRHIRFDAKRVDPVLFPDTSKTMASVTPAEKVISITHNQFVHPDAKNDGERTYGPMSWKRADGKHKSKECDRSVIGVIVVGEEQGAAFRVCIDKQKCTTHWGSEIRARKERETKTSRTVAKFDSKGAASTPPGKSKWEIEREQRDAKNAVWKKTEPAVVKALVDRVKQLSPATLISVIEGERRVDRDSEKLFGRGKGLEGFVRLMAFDMLRGEATGHGAYEYFPKYAKQIGLDLKKILEANAPPPAKAAAVTSTKPVFAKEATKTPTKKGKAKLRTPNAAFMKPMEVSAQLAAVVGAGPMPKTEITKKLWSYIKRNQLQDVKERRMINADEKLKLVFGGKSKASMFEMTKLINKHLR